MIQAFRDSFVLPVESGNIAGNYRTSVFSGGCLERRVTFFKESFLIKNKLKSGIFNDKKVVYN